MKTKMKIPMIREWISREKLGFHSIRTKRDENGRDETSITREEEIKVSMTPI